MFICRALTLRWLCGWKLLELQFVAEQITSLHFLDSLNSSRLVGRVMFFRNVTASAFGSTYLICEVTKVDYFKLVKKCLQGQCPQYFREFFRNPLSGLVKPMSLSFSIHVHHTLIRQDTILSRVTKSSRDEWDQSRTIAVVSHFITSLKIK